MIVRRWSFSWSETDHIQFEIKEDEEEYGEDEY